MQTESESLLGIPRCDVANEALPASRTSLIRICRDGKRTATVWRGCQHRSSPNGCNSLIRRFRQYFCFKLAIGLTRWQYNIHSNCPEVKALRETPDPARLNISRRSQGYAWDSYIWPVACDDAPALRLLKLLGTISVLHCWQSPRGTTDVLLSSRG
jgi:hypothetical protein